MAHILLLDKAVMRLEANLRRLDIVEQRLEEIRSQPSGFLDGISKE